MPKLPVIITICNMKGGVGKSTLCTLLANYFAIRGIKVFIIDGDAQTSIAKTRIRELDEYPNETPLYDIESFMLMSKNKVFTDCLRNVLSKKPEVVLIDCPASFSGENFPKVIQNTDIVIVPFTYNKFDVEATGVFLKALEKARECWQLHSMKVYLVPNRIDGRQGTKKEFTERERIRDFFTNFGHVLPVIPMKANMTRVGTMASLDMHEDLVKQTFSILYSQIFGTEKPLRPMTLHGIQLSDRNKGRLTEPRKPQPRVKGRFVAFDDIPEEAKISNSIIQNNLD